MSKYKSINIESMAEILIEFIIEDSSFSYPLYDEGGNVVLDSRKIFTVQLKQSLLDRDVAKLFYHKKQLCNISNSALYKYLERKDYKGPQTISFETQKKALTIMDQLIIAVNNVIPKFDQSDIEELVEAINEDLNKGEHEIINLLDVIDYDDYTYTHSLNVGVISTFFARQLHLSLDEIKQVGIGAFLHDIGKLKIPIEILNKPDKLSAEEFSIMKEHSALGVDILKADNKISPIAKEIILYHHEKYNGTGYPQGLKGDDYKLFYEIVSLADIYDALTSKRPYKEALTAQKAIEIILDCKNQFRPTTLKVFKKNMNIMFRESWFYPENSFVILNSNELAMIVTNNKTIPLKPLIKILGDKNGSKLSDPFLVDLTSDPTRTIIKSFKLK